MSGESENGARKICSTPCFFRKQVMDMNSSSDFKLLDRKVVDVLLTLPERNTFFRALTFWAGFDTRTVEYEVQERKYGKSKWSLWGLMKYAISNATSFSTLPLQLVTMMGTISIVFSVILGIQTFVKWLCGDSVEGFTTVILLILIIGGFIMLSLGVEVSSTSAFASPSALPCPGRPAGVLDGT